MGLGSNNLVFFFHLTCDFLSLAVVSLQVAQDLFCAFFVPHLHGAPCASHVQDVPAASPLSKASAANVVVGKAFDDCVPDGREFIDQNHFGDLCVEDVNGDGLEIEVPNVELHVLVNSQDALGVCTKRVLNGVAGHRIDAAKLMAVTAWLCNANVHGLCKFVSAVSFSDGLVSLHRAMNAYVVDDVEARADGCFEFRKGDGGGVCELLLNAFVEGAQPAGVLGLCGASDGCFGFVAYGLLECFHDDSLNVLDGLT